MAFVFVIQGPAAFFYVSSWTTFPVYASDTGMGKTTPCKVLDPARYETMEIFIQYQSGEIKVISCKDRDSLEASLKELSAGEDIAILQPNYVYGRTALSVNDASLYEQWALYNDGTFSIEEMKNSYQVFDDPFGRPLDPGEWTKHWSFTDFPAELTGTEIHTSTPGIDINVEEAWAQYGGGARDVVVAMIDTGIDFHHEDLADSLWINSGEIPGNGVDDDGNGYVDDVYGWNFYNNNNEIFIGDEDSHGTHGAGTIAASSNNGIGIAGIVPGNRVRVMAIKALGGQEGGGSTASLIRAIRYAEDNGAVICNLSLTSATDDAALYQAIAASDMLFVAAAGNGDSRTGLGQDTDVIPCYPASYDLDNIISVANLNFDGNLHKSSNYGLATVDLAAPGSYILSATPGNQYGYMTGTSMAAPMVSGAAAMVYSYFDGISPADVKEILLASVTPMENLQGRLVTGGRLNVGSALKFDIGALSRQGFKNAGIAPDNGTAPFIETRIMDQGERRLLFVRVLDIDGDLARLSYGKGELKEEQFSLGQAGKPFTINEKDLAVFQIDGPGIYTFYAEDARGNRTVQMVEFADVSEGPGFE